VIGVGITALMLAYVYRLHRIKHSLDISDFTELKW
jgi:multicomponent Na+:H+ antiporter subunit C